MSPGRMASLALVLWTGAAAAALWFGRETPPPPPPTEDTELVAVQARQVERVREEVDTWAENHGDRNIPWADAKGHLAIVIDDVGRDLEAMEALQALRHPLTFSVLPGAIYAPGAQLRLRADPRRYREIWLHLPMEPMDAAQMFEGDEAREDFLRVADSPEALQRKVLAAIEHVPAAVGVNNHMGSRLSADPRAMAAVMESLAPTGLAFLDSRTTPETVAADAARAAGIPTISRQVFLDHDTRPAAMASALEEAIRQSRRGPTVAIGHPSPELAAVLEAGLARAHRDKIGIYPLSQLIGRDRASLEMAELRPEDGSP